MPPEPEYVAHLCFDECMPRMWCKRLAEMLRLKKEPVEAFNLVDRYASGLGDDAVTKWIVAHKPRLLMISGDSGAQSGRDPRLPKLLPAHGITGVFLAPRMAQKEGFERVRALIVCMPAIIRAYHATPGERYSLRESGDGYAIDKWPVVNRPLPVRLTTAPSPHAARRPSVPKRKDGQPELFPP